MSEPHEDSGLAQVVVRGASAQFQQRVDVRGHTLVSDEPREAGGSDAGATPYDLLLASLGACTSMTIGLYARRKGWPLAGIEVRLSHSKVHADDCADCETRDGHLDRIDRRIVLTGELSPEQRGRLLEIANKCPVHRTLAPAIEIRTSLEP